MNWKNTGETYQKQGWNLKPNFREMYNPLLTVSAVADNKALYAEFAAKAEEFIYSSLPTTMAVKVAETQNADKIILTEKLQLGFSARKMTQSD